MAKRKLTKAQVLRELVKRRGHLTIWRDASRDDWKIGQTIHKLGGEAIDIGQSFIITKKGSQRDFVIQQRMNAAIEPRWWIMTVAKYIRNWKARIGGKVNYWHLEPWRKSGDRP